MKKFQVVLAVVLLASLILTACGGAATQSKCTDEWGCAEIKKGETLKYAYVGPMTGDYSAFGIDMSRGAQIAVQEKPEIKGFKVELLVEDTQGAPEQGAAVANKLSADPRVIGISGHTFSGSTEVAIPIYEKAHIVMVSASATNPKLTDLGSAIFNRVVFQDRMQSDFATKYIYNTLKIKNIAIVHDGSAYGKGLADMVSDFFGKLGGKVVAMQAVTPGETDYSAPLAAISAAKPELIYFGGYAADAAVVVNQLERAGMKGVKFFGCDGTYGEDFLNLTKANGEGAFSTYVPIPESAEFTKFQATYKNAYGVEQGKLSPFSPHSHDATAVLLAATDKVAIQSGDTLLIPRKALADAVRATSGFKGLTGTLTCSKTGECAAATIQFMTVTGGKWVKATGQ
jgi:branched-chain amino acid transport system substrate-binding protein